MTETTTKASTPLTIPESTGQNVPAVKTIDPTAPAPATAQEDAPRATLSKRIKERRAIKKRDATTQEIEREEKEAPAPQPKPEAAPEPVPGPTDIAAARLDFWRKQQDELNAAYGVARELTYEEHKQAVNMLFALNRPADALNLWAGKQVEAMRLEGQFNQIAQRERELRGKSTHVLLTDIAQRHPHMLDADYAALWTFSAQFAQRDPEGEAVHHYVPQDVRRQAYADRLAAAFQHHRITAYGYSPKHPQQPVAQQAAPIQLFNSPYAASTGADTGATARAQEPAEPEGPQTLSDFLRTKRAQKVHSSTTTRPGR